MSLEFTQGIELASKAVDAAGVAVIVVGIVVVAARVISSPAGERYRISRRRLGRVILLGLELLVAADIIRTVVVEPSLESAGALGLIVLIRTWLSFSLEVELEHRWPWQREGDGGRAAGSV